MSKMNPDEFAPYLVADYFADWKNPKITKFVQAIVKPNFSHQETAIALYHHIRDHFLYDAFQFSLDKTTLRASEFVERKSGHCIDKANLLIACARHQNIPARYRFANVRNHIGTERIHAILKTDVLVFHGIAELFINGKWIKLTPAFNKSLCDKLNVSVMDFNGEDETVFQQYSNDGNTFMEYLYDHGSFDALPYEKINSGILKAYPHLREVYEKSKRQYLFTLNENSITSE